MPVPYLVALWLKKCTADAYLMFEIAYQILKEFVSLTLLVLPYFIIGSGFGALLETYLKPDFAFKYLNRGTFSVVNASILGAILPGCSCATVPMANGLKKKGASLGTISAFVMVSPLLSPHTVVLNYGMLGLKFTVARIIFSLTGAIILGIVFNYFEKIKLNGFTFLPNSSNKKCECSSSSCKEEAEKEGFWKSFIEIVKSLSKYFVLGMFIASLLTVLITEDAIPKYIGSSGSFAYIVAVLVGIPIYICEGEEIPITLSLLKLGLGKGPAFAFLLGSVGTCIPTMVMVQKIISSKPTFFYIIGWFIFAIGSGILFNLLF